jgi:transposase
VLEVNQPHPDTRHRRGKSDAVDAEAAARKVLSGEATAVPKYTTGPVEAIRLLRGARASAVKARAAAVTQ